MKRFNLLPPEVGANRKSKARNFKYAAALALIIVGIAGLWFVRDAERGRQEDRLAAAESEATRAQMKVAALQEFAVLDQTIKTKGTVLAQAMAQDVGWSRMLKEIAMTMPEDSWLTGFQASVEPALAAVPAAPVASGAPAAAPAPVVAPRWGTANFTAVTFDFPGVAGWIRSMQDKMPSFTTVFVPSATESEIGGREVINYTGTVDITESSASGRFKQGVK